MTPRKGTPRLLHGDLFEFRVDSTSAYFQYTHDDRRFGFVIRVLPGTYAERPSDVCSVAQQREVFYACYPLDVVFKAGEVVRVARCDVPSFARDFPLFRIGRESADGRITRWILYDGETEHKLGEVLDSEHRRLSVYQLLNHAALREMVREGYRPENDYKPPTQRPSLLSRLLGTRSEATGSTERETRESGVVVRHYLVFSEETSARSAAAEARRMGLDVETSPDSDDGAEESQWNVTILRRHVGSTPLLSDEGSEMALLASRHGGTYDGNEVGSA